MSKNEIIEICTEFAQGVWNGCKEEFIKRGYTKEMVIKNAIEKGLKDESWIPKFIIHEGKRYFIVDRAS